LLNREKYDMIAELDGKNREIVILNEDIISLKENLDTYKSMVSHPARESLKEGGRLSGPCRKG